ncbi:hypothetical protein ACHAPT_007951 [Fusarium lateritium]
MARLRSQGKASPVSIPDSRKRRKSRTSTSATTSLLSDGESSIHTRGRSAPKSKTSEEPPSSQRRQTRSHSDNQTFEFLGPPTKRKRRRTIVEPEDQPTKRQHSDDAGAEEEEQPSQNHDLKEDDDDDESALPGEGFFMAINKNVLPELRPDDNAEHLSENEGRTEIVVEVSQDDDGDVGDDNAEDDPDAADEAVAEVDTEIEDSQAGRDVEGLDQVSVPVEDREEPDTPSKQPASTELPEPAEQDDIEPGPDPSQPKPSQSGKRKKRRQNRKPTYVEPDYQVPGAASPDLGSNLRRSQTRQPSKSKQLPSKAQVDALFEFKGDDEDSQRERQQGKEQVQKSIAAQVAKKGGKTRSQATRRLGGKKKDLTERSASEADDNSDNDPNNDDNSDDDEELPNPEPRVEHESGNGPDQENEPDSDDEAEDSLLVDPPKEHEPALATKMHGKVVQRLVTIMTLSGWMGKRKWGPDVKLEAASAKRDFEKARNDNSEPLATSKIILARLYSLWGLCNELPTAPELEEQNKYFREHKTETHELISKIHQLVERYVSGITTLMRLPKDTVNQIASRRIISKLHRRIIPMLVWLLRATFLAGCDIPEDQRPQAVNRTGEFTIFTLQLLKRVAGWTRRLGEVLVDWSGLNSSKATDTTATNTTATDKKKHWEELSPAVETLQSEIEEALKRIEQQQNAPEERRKAHERDQALLRARKEKERREQETRDQQMQRFIESTQRKESSQTESQSQSIKSQSDLDAAYFEKHGWHYCEDDTLLKAVRSAQRPNCQVLAAMCPGRSPAEVTQRVKDLKDKARNKYERMGMAPPLWCYEDA